MNRVSILISVCASLVLSGCVFRTAADIATAPIRAAGGAVDLVTTSQSEADEKRGREVRRQEARLGELRRDYDDWLRRCENGDRSACEKARASHAKIEALLPTVPAPPSTD